MKVDHCSKVVPASKAVFTPFTKNVGVPGEITTMQEHRRGSVFLLAGNASYRRPGWRARWMSDAATEGNWC